MVNRIVDSEDSSRLYRIILSVRRLFMSTIHTMQAIGKWQNLSSNKQVANKIANIPLRRHVNATFYTRPQSIFWIRPYSKYPSPWCPFMVAGSRMIHHDKQLVQTEYHFHHLTKYGAISSSLGIINSSSSKSILIKNEPINLLCTRL